MFRVHNAVLLHAASSSPGGKFFLAMVVHDTDDNTYYHVDNHGAGRGFPSQSVWGRTGQAHVYGPWRTIDAAIADMNSKVTDKVNHGYSGNQVANVLHIDERIVRALEKKKQASATPPAQPTTPVVAAPGPSTSSMTTYTLLSEPFTPELVPKILTHRHALATEAKDLKGRLANIEAEDKMLVLRLSSYTT